MVDFGVEKEQASCHFSCKAREMYKVASSFPCWICLPCFATRYLSGAKNGFP